MELKQEDPKKTYLSLGQEVGQISHAVRPDSHNDGVACTEYDLAGQADGYKELKIDSWTDLKQAALPYFPGNSVRNASMRNLTYSHT
jgi:hypothetical protein